MNDAFSWGIIPFLERSWETYPELCFLKWPFTRADAKEVSIGLYTLIFENEILLDNLGGQKKSL